MRSRRVTAGDVIFLKDGTSGCVSRVADDMIFLGKTRGGCDPGSDYVRLSDESWSETPLSSARSSRHSAKERPAVSKRRLDAQLPSKTTTAKTKAAEAAANEATAAKSKPANNKATKTKPAKPAKPTKPAKPVEPAAKKKAAADAQAHTDGDTGADPASTMDAVTSSEAESAAWEATAKNPNDVDKATADARQIAAAAIKLKRVEQLLLREDERDSRYGAEQPPPGLDDAESAPALAPQLM